jgi:hypothetical protein
MDQAFKHLEGRDLQTQIEREEARLAASKARLQTLRDVAAGRAKERELTVNAVWYRRSPRRIYGAALYRFQNHNGYQAMCCTEPVELYGWAFMLGLLKVAGKTKRLDGLVVRVPKLPDAQTRWHLFEEPGFWTERFGLGGMLVGTHLSAMLSKGPPRFRLSPLTEDEQRRLDLMARQAKHLKYGQCATDLPEHIFEAYFNKPLRALEGITPPPPLATWLSGRFQSQTLSRTATAVANVYSQATVRTLAADTIEKFLR